MSDYRQQQEQDEQQSHLWHCLCALKGHISAELWDEAERQIGMAEQPNEDKHGQARI